MIRVLRLVVIMMCHGHVNLEEWQFKGRLSHILTLGLGLYVLMRSSQFLLQIQCFRHGPSMMIHWTIIMEKGCFQVLQQILCFLCHPKLINCQAWIPVVMVKRCLLCLMILLQFMNIMQVCLVGIYSACFMSGQ
uniref:Uncharacterized protein n=1 Tax=Rhizophora mucronata TaxID=61149 RepID=A0A2P2KIU2_RHIMU